MNMLAATITHTGMTTTMSNRHGLYLITMSLFVVGSAIGQTSNGEQSKIPSDANEAAVESLNTYEALFPQRNVETLNEQGPQAKATLGEPMRDYIIGLNSLKSWDGNDPSILLISTDRIVYPIADNSVVQSDVTISKKNGRWEAVAFGSTTEAQSRSRIRDEIKTKVPSGPGGQEATFIQVRIPALNVSFLAQQESGQLIFAPIQSVPNLGIEAGKREPATQVLHRLQPAAKQIDSNVPN